MTSGNEHDDVVSVGRFEIQGKLGAGGMGVVYVARDRDSGRLVALKLLRRTGADPRRLQREARALARLDHPNVVAIHDVGEVDGRTYIAMELVEGPTLREWLAEGRSWREIVDVFCQVGEGLAAAHRSDIVHRDLKPDNIIIGTDPRGADAWRVRVLDFGLARATARSTQPISIAAVTAAGATTTGSLKGTPAYMAPEQILGRVTTAHADQFAITVSLWEALFGRRPFDGTRPDALLPVILAGRLPDPDRGDIPPAVIDVLRRGLAVEPDQRFEDMAAWLAALRAAAGVPRSSRRWVIGLALVAVVALALVVRELLR